MLSQRMAATRQMQSWHCCSSAMASIMNPCSSLVRHSAALVLMSSALPILFLPNLALLTSHFQWQRTVCTPTSPYPLSSHSQSLLQSLARPHHSLKSNPQHSTLCLLAICLLASPALLYCVPMLLSLRSLNTCRLTSCHNFSLTFVCQVGIHSFQACMT